MSTKRKVQFSDTKRVKKFDKNEEKYDSGSDIESGDEPNNKPKPKHTLDSDEEDNTDKYKLLNQECLHDIGQEAKTKEFDDDIKLTPFNMKDELDDGNFDTDGFYHWKSKNKDDQDAWLDNIEWANVNTFKDKYNLQKEKGDEEKDSDSETEEPIESDIESLNNEKDQIEIFEKILGHLKPGETVLKAIKRLGNSSKSSIDNISKTGLSASQRWIKKKAPISTQGNLKPVDPEQAKLDKESLELLTGYANHFIDRGYYDIYEDTFEKLTLKLKENEPGNKADPFDIFADEVENVTASTSGNKANLIEDSIVKWVYKIENTDDSKINGPFTSLQMLEMSEKGDFKETGVWCRKLEESAGVSFYNSKRIDFELYT